MHKVATLFAAAEFEFLVIGLFVVVAFALKFALASALLVPAFALSSLFSPCASAGAGGPRSYWTDVFNKALFGSCQLTSDRLLT